MSDIEIKVPTLEEITARAYENYLKRGAQEGIALEDRVAAGKKLGVSSQTGVSDPTVA